MLGDEELERIQQELTNALSTRHLHETKKSRYGQYSFIVDLAVMTGTGLLLTIRLLTPDHYKIYADHVSEAVLAILFAATILKMLAKWQEKTEAHAIAMSKNIGLATESKRLLRLKDQMDLTAYDYFVKIADDVEVEDRKLLGLISNDERQQAYRQALKELNCSCACGAKPWKFVKGNCQICGGAPHEIKGGEK